MRARFGRNAPCFCGSGKKLKRCCGGDGSSSGFTWFDRQKLFEKLDDFVMDFDHEGQIAFGEWWGHTLPRASELPETLIPFSAQAYDIWFAFDRPLDDDGTLLVDERLESASLTAGERRFASVLRSSEVHLWEVVDAVPGVSLALRDLLEGQTVTVRERSASKTLALYECIAGRIVPRGASGEPEIEAGLLHVPRLYRDALLQQLVEMRTEFLDEDPEQGLRDFYREVPPIVHQTWAGSVLEPALPKLHNSDGEPILMTRVTFDVNDLPALKSGLDANVELEREANDAWRWCGLGTSGDSVGLGILTLDGTRLVLEANSAERGERGRRMIETTAGESARYRITTHEDLDRALRERLLASFDNPERDSAEVRQNGLPPHVAEALVLDHYAKHYNAWIDEPVPALGGATPRAAAKDPALRTKLTELIQGLEGIYQKALRQGEPAYDPSWMWAELGFEDAGCDYPPPLAHERMDEIVPGLREVCHSVAEDIRKRPSFDDRSTTVTDGAWMNELAVQRFVRELRPAANDAQSKWSAESLSAYLGWMINFDLHRRKAFWVDESLSYMLACTDLDALGRELRAPFPSFALIFTDRGVLSLGERLLSRDKTCPLAGQMLRVATVFITEEPASEGRLLRVCFAFDALGSDPPALVEHAVPLSDDEPVQRYLDSVSSEVVTEPVVENASPVRRLLQVVINAILYATSAGVEPELRGPLKGSPKSQRGKPPEPTSSEQVFFLPGAIEISHLRSYQALERLREGREVLRRFMVRGHWRRASKNWQDQRLRWIGPYWKGPDMAAIIERTYKLTP